MSFEERQRLRETLGKLRIAADLERKAMAESDRLLTLAVGMGATDATLGAAMGVSLDTVRMRRRRRRLRKPGNGRGRRAA